MAAISSGKKDFINTFLLVILYAAGFYCLQLFLFKATFLQTLPDELNLLHWDSGWYCTLSRVGYIYDPTGVNNLAFFPLFPLIWHIAHVGVWGMACLNVLFFATGISILDNLFKPGTQNKILWLSMPAVYFCFIPYSEAVFFLLTTITFYGIRNNKKLLVWISLFLLSLTRPTGVLLAPSFLAMTLLSAGNKRWYKSLFSYLTVYLSPMVLGTGLFIWYEYLKSGVWFVFFDIEKKYWGHVLNIPMLPFNNNYNQSLSWISAIAVFIGFFSFLFLLNRFFKWLFKNNIQDDLLILSCSYLFMSLIAIIFYNPTWSGNTTNIAGIYRYTLMNPFFYVFLNYFTNVARYSWKNYLFVFFLANVVWASFGAYVHIQYFLLFTASTIIIFMYMLHANKKLTWPVMILTALNIFFQVQFFQQFISNIFPD